MDAERRPEPDATEPVTGPPAAPECGLSITAQRWLVLVLLVLFALQVVLTSLQMSPA